MLRKLFTSVALSTTLLASVAVTGCTPTNGRPYSLTGDDTRRTSYFDEVEASRAQYKLVAGPAAHRVPNSGR